MKKHQNLYDKALSLLQEGEIELGEMRLQEFCEKTGVPVYYTLTKNSDNRG
jgi:hypothetical protein